MDVLFCLFILTSHSVVMAEFSTYPSIYWNPWNPIFACEDPTINVRIGDTINFLCPSDEYKFYVPPSTDVNIIHENLWFLGDQDQENYTKCDARGARQLLRCDGQKANYYTISFRDVVTSARAIEFEKGKTYYLIGTGYRTLDRLDDDVGGSCNHTGSDGQFRLRLKIRVCENDKDCDICKTAGCYYKNCRVSCTPWVTHGYIEGENGGCLKVEKRQCHYPYFDNNNRTEYRETKHNSSKCSPGVGRQTGDKRPLCDNSSEIYKVLFVISVAILFVVLLILLCYKRCCIGEKENTYDAEYPKDVQALNGCNNPVGKTNPGYRNSTKMSIHLPKMPSFRNSSNKSPTAKHPPQHPL